MKDKKWDEPLRPEQFGITPNNQTEKCPDCGSTTFQPAFDPYDHGDPDQARDCVVCGCRMYTWSYRFRRLGIEWWVEGPVEKWATDRILELGMHARIFLRPVDKSSGLYVVCIQRGDGAIEEPPGFVIEGRERK